jgi:GNAT superfamily N-acetyltransferase
MTPFVSVELAHRIEQAEARLTRELGERVVAADPRGPAFVEEVAGGIAAYAGPASPMNKLIGAGFGGPADPAALDGLEEKFAARQAPLQAEVSTLAEPAFGAALVERGYVLQGFENVLGRPIAASGALTSDPPEGVEVRPVGPGELVEWLDVMITAFAAPDRQGVAAPALPPREALEAVLRPLADAPSFSRHGAFVGGRMVGAANMRLDLGVAQLCGAAVLPEFRRRGIQSAFLRRRLADALAAGCTLALVTTQPGSKSQENVQAQGFSLLYCRALLVKPPRPTLGETPA